MSRGKLGRLFGHIYRSNWLAIPQKARCSGDYSENMEASATHLTPVAPPSDTIGGVSDAVTSKTVVVAEATGLVLGRFTAALEGAGHRAVSAKSAAELLARVRADLDEIDLLIIDLRLPHAAGVELIRSVRRFDRGRLPILVLSGTIENARQVRELAQLNVAGYINEHTVTERILPALAPHLFPDSFNRRSSSRIVLSLPTSYRSSETVSTATTLNLGKGGVAVRTVSPIDHATKARTQFRLPGSNRDIDADARIVWSDRRGSMGLQFERIDPVDQTAIDEFVDTHLPPARS